MASVNIAFGPWAPDMSDNGVPLTSFSTNIPNTVPCADVLNVYFRDSNYRCLPNISPTGPTLGIPITNAVTWYDNSTGSEEVFAATANGIYALVDGTWSQIPVQTNSGINAQGQVITVTQGTPTYTVTNYSFSISPSSQTESGAGLSYTFAAETITSSPAASAYSWYFVGASGSGTWSIASGQGTNAAVAQVTGCTPAQTSSVLLYCQLTIGGSLYHSSCALSYTPAQIYSGTLVAGEANPGTDTIIGYYPGLSIGSISPAADAYGNTVETLAWVESALQLQLVVSGTLPQNYFTTLTAGSSYPSASATWTQSGGTTAWVWSVGSTPFIDGDSYPVSYE